MVIKDVRRGFYYGGRGLRGGVLWSSAKVGAKQYSSKAYAARGAESLVRRGIRLGDELAIVD